MFSSLQKIDVVAADPDGQPVYHQTDHRPAEEIEGEPEVSVLFALARVLNARAHEAPKTVFYNCQFTPPAFLQAVVASAGGVLLCATESSPAGAPVPWTGPLTPVSDLADQAFGQLAARVAARHSLPVTDELLAAIEGASLQEPIDAEHDEIGYWTRVAELAAVSGELIRQRVGGGWKHDIDKPLGILPFSFHLPGGAKVNAADKACRFLERGANQAVSKLVGALGEVTGAEGPGTPMLAIKPGDHPHRDLLVCWPLVDCPSEHAAVVPIAVACRDSPRTIAWTKRTASEDFEVHRRKALENIAAIDVTIEEVLVGDTRVFAVGGHFFAVEKVLDVDFLRALGKRLGTTFLALGLPHRGMLLVADGQQVEFVSTRLLAICQKFHSDPGDNEPLSPVPFLADDGVIVGYVLPQEEEADPDGDEPEEQQDKRAEDPTPPTDPS